MMPEILLKAPIYDAEAEKLQTCFTPGVIELEADERGMTSTHLFALFRSRRCEPSIDVSR